MVTATPGVSQHHEAQHGRENGSGPLTPDSAVVEALAALLQVLNPQPAALESDEVVLCVELHGTRYSLAQRRLPEPRATVKLSAREREIARLISAGHTNKTVAVVLDISLWTVDTHIRRIFAKLGVRSRSAMVAQLAEYGLLGQDAHR